MTSSNVTFRATSNPVGLPPQMMLAQQQQQQQQLPPPQQLTPQQFPPQFPPTPQLPQQVSLADPIDSLPTDNNAPTQTEAFVTDTLFKQQQTVNKFLDRVKDVLIVGFIFILFSLKQVDELICKVVPACEKSPYILLGIKTLFFMLAYFIVKNIYLVRK